MASDPEKVNRLTLHADHIEDRCPSCGAKSLFLGVGGWLTCAVIGCKSPAVTETFERLREENARLADEHRKVHEWNDKLVAEHYQLREENARLNAMRTHCDHCGADYLATGVEAGCPCRLREEIARLETSEAAEFGILKVEVARLTRERDEWRQNYENRTGHLKDAEADRDRLRERVAALEERVRRSEEAFRKIAGASYGELRTVVEHYGPDPSAKPVFYPDAVVHRTHATPEEWQVAYRVAGWFSAIADAEIAALTPGGKAEGGRDGE